MANKVRESVLVLAMLVLLSPPAVRAQGTSDQWEWRASLYGWLPDINGKTQFPSGGSGPDISIDASQLLSNLDFTLQGALQVRKGRWGAFTDVIYLNEGANKLINEGSLIGGSPLPPGVALDLNLDLRSVVWTVAGVYQILDTSNSSTDFLFGTRLLDIDQTLNWRLTGDYGEIPLQPAGSANSSLTNWDFVVGLKGRIGLGSEMRWFLPYYFDMGTGDSQFTFELMGGVGYGFRWGEIVGVWRYLDYDFESGDAVQSMTFDGPAIGVVFAW
jgi:hypothetical protein